MHARSVQWSCTDRRTLPNWAEKFPKPFYAKKMHYDSFSLRVWGLITSTVAILALFHTLPGKLVPSRKCLWRSKRVCWRFRCLETSREGSVSRQMACVFRAFEFLALLRNTENYQNKSRAFVEAFHFSARSCSTMFLRRPRDCNRLSASMRIESSLPVISLAFNPPRKHIQIAKCAEIHKLANRRVPDHF